DMQSVLNKNADLQKELTAAYNKIATLKSKHAALREECVASTTHLTHHLKRPRRPLEI
ncbi:hypothetical protein HDU87_001709, partial [Geranomyces variabilis]